MLKIFKDFENWDPEGARLADEEVKRIAFEASGAKDMEQYQYKSAVDVVYYDGMYGPIQDYEFEEDGEFYGTFESFAEAHRMVVKAIDASYPDYEYCNYDYDVENCGECTSCINNDCLGDGLTFEPCENPPNNCFIEGRTIRDEMFSWYKRIYGGF